MTVDLAALAAPTPPDEIKQRPGPKQHSGECTSKYKCDLPHMLLDYVDARWVMQRLDDAVGPENWQDKYEEHVNGSVRCGIGIRIADVQDWVWKWDVGDPSDIEPAKGAHSEALKRAGVKWGIARDLYGDHARPQQAPRRSQTAPDASQRESVVIGSPRPVLVAAGPVRDTLVRASIDAAYEDVVGGGPDLDEDGWAGLVSEPTASIQGRGAVPSNGTDQCPVHGKPFKVNTRGKYCATKVGDGWCQEKGS